MLYRLTECGVSLHVVGDSFDQRVAHSRISRIKSLLGAKVYFVEVVDEILELIGLWNNTFPFRLSLCKRGFFVILSFRFCLCGNSMGLSHELVPLIIILRV